MFATFPTYLDDIPIFGMLHMGRNISHIQMGGASIGGATIGRFYAAHYGISVIALIFVEYYFWRRGTRRVSLPWTTQAILLGMLALVAAILPAALGTRSNPVVTPNPILSDWYFLGMYQMFKYMHPIAAVIWTALIPPIAMVLPFLDLKKEKAAWKRPFFTIVGLGALLYFILFSALIILGFADIKRDPPFWYSSIILFSALGALMQWGEVAMSRYITYVVAFLTLASFLFFKGIFTSPVWIPTIFILAFMCGTAEVLHRFVFKSPSGAKGAPSA